MKRLYKSQKGSVSIFLMIIFMAIFIFNAVLIDYARVMAANKQTENALRAGLRSVLAAYDTELQEQYGIFGLGDVDGEAIFRHVVEHNLTTFPGTFTFVDHQIEEGSLSLESGHVLGYHEVFKQQILEDMKYKAPIDFTLDIIDRFGPLERAVQEAAIVTSTLRDMKWHYEQREKHLKILQDNQSNALSKIEDHSKTFEQDITSIAEQYAQFVSDFYTYQEEKEQDNQGNYSVSTAEIRMNTYLHVSSSALSQAESLMTQHQADLEKAIKEIENVQRENLSMIKRLEKAREERANLKPSQHESVVPQEEIKAITNLGKESEEMIFQEDFFQALERRIKQQEVAIQELTRAVGAMQSLYYGAVILDPEYRNDHQIEQNQDSLTRLAHEVKEEYNSYLQQARAIVTEQNADINARKMDEETKAQNKKHEEEATLGLKEIMELIDKLKQLKSKKDDYSTVGSYFNDYAEFNNLAKAEDPKIEVDNDSEQETVRALDQISSLFSSVGDMLTNMRDEVYINEYIFQRFTYMDPTVLKDIQSLTSFEEIENKLDIKNQEIEYILYGLEAPGLNVAAAFGEIFAFRLAINTMEAFRYCVGTGNPITVLLCAIAKGISNTIEDILRLINGNTIQFSRFFPNLDLTYEDHLRFFLLIHSGNNRLFRMKSIIQFNTGKNLKFIPTYTSGEVVNSIDLWFVPMIIKGLGKVGILDGNVDGNDYIFYKVIYTNY